PRGSRSCPSATAGPFRGGSSTSPRARSSTSASSRPPGAPQMQPEEQARREMVELQLRARDIVDENVLRAMERVPRELFVPERERRRAYEDAALPMGYGHAISQPYMVARICEALSVRPGHKVLDVGTGSGYQAAVLAEVGAEVVTIERMPELAEQARANLAAAGYDQVEVQVGDGSRGVADRAPF